MPQRSTWLLPLLGLLLIGCTQHQLTQQTLQPVSTTPYATLQVQVQFDSPAHSEYLATRLVTRLAQHGVSATILPAEADPQAGKGGSPAILQLHLTETWTETFISTRQMPRRSLTQMRGRIPRESPRFTTDTKLVDAHSGQTVWQLQTISAAPWYDDFNASADSLANRLTQQLITQGLVAAPRG